MCSEGTAVSGLLALLYFKWITASPSLWPNYGPALLWATYMKAVFSLEMTGDFQPLFPDGCSDVFISTGQYMFFMGSEIGDLKLQQQGLPMEGLLLVTSVQFFSVFHWRSCLCTTKSIQLCKVKTVWTILTQLTNPPPFFPQVSSHCLTISIWCPSCFHWRKVWSPFLNMYSLSLS